MAIACGFNFEYFTMLKFYVDYNTYSALQSKWNPKKRKDRSLPDVDSVHKLHREALRQISSTEWSLPAFKSAEYKLQFHGRIPRGMLQISAADSQKIFLMEKSIL